MKRIVSIVGLIVGGLAFLPVASNAQHSIVYSQYIFNPLLINPATAGSHVQLSAALTYRNQWVNFEGAPQTATFGIHSSVRKGQVGVGLLVTNDQIGSYSNTGVFGSYAYRIRKPGGGVLALGIQGGFNNFVADFGNLNMRSQQDPIFNVFVNELKPNFGGGVYYYNKKMFAGFAVPVILTYKKTFSETLEQLSQPRYYYIHGGMIIPLNRFGTVKFSPSVLIRAQEGTPLSGDVNLNLIFHDVISLGTSYRTGDAVVTFVNFKLSEKFYVGYSYDWTTSDIRRYSKGTHEVMLNYRVRIRGIHKDLECPHYFSN